MYEKHMHNAVFTTLNVYPLNSSNYFLQQGFGCSLGTYQEAPEWQFLTMGLEVELHWEKVWVANKVPTYCFIVFANKVLAYSSKRLLAFLVVTKSFQTVTCQRQNNLRIELMVLSVLTASYWQQQVKNG
jgi:hypothetical protein